MKKTILLTSFFGMIIFISFQLLADSSENWELDSLIKSSGNSEPPCHMYMHMLAMSCRKAGYKGGAKSTPGKTLSMDCIKPILAGQKITGVTVDPATTKMCKDLKARGRN